MDLVEAQRAVGEPATPAAVIADIATQYPGLRAAVAAHPAAYPGLLEWLDAVGDPAVKAAVAARRGGPAPAVPAAPVAPVVQPAVPAQAYPSAPAYETPSYTPGPGYSQASAYEPPVLGGAYPAMSAEPDLTVYEPEVTPGYQPSAYQTPAPYQPAYPVSAPTYQPRPADAPNFGYAVLGFFIPVVGLILFLVWREQTPLKAKSAGKGALISVIAGVVFYVIFVAILGAAFNSYR
ncbi:MAG: hypothetical protein LBI33_12260 [Propionibacteriaceae bacterium]|jgi:hypothetical protein|nr:hypothetical protein [Propionibacteriaceae bacterium]